MELFFVLAFLVLPVVYLLAIAKEFAEGSVPALILSLLVVAAVAITGVWALRHSRSDWASIGYVLVAGEAPLAGLLVLAFSRWRNAPMLRQRILSWGALPVSLLFVLYNVFEGTQNIQENIAADEFDEAHGGQVDREEKFIEGELGKRGARGHAWLDSTIRTRMQDSAFLTAAVRYDFIDPELLDTLARSQFQEVAVRAILNPGTRSGSLAKSYRANSASDIRVEALAHNSRTPQRILRDIYHRANNGEATQNALAANPASPRDVLTGLAESATYPETIHFLLTNPELDCDLLGKIASYLAGKGKTLNVDYNVVARMNDVRPIVCQQRSNNR
jgi:hypothetical protein